MTEQLGYALYTESPRQHRRLEARVRLATDAQAFARELADRVWADVTITMEQRGKVLYTYQGTAEHPDALAPFVESLRQKHFAPPTDARMTF